MRKSLEKPEKLLRNKGVTMSREKDLAKKIALRIKRKKRVRAKYFWYS